MLSMVGLLFTLIGLLFTGLGSLFTIIGICILISNRKKKKEQALIFEKGTKYSNAMIVDHVSGSGVTFNGMLPIALVVKCKISGIEREFVYNTNEYDASKYPINSYCDIYVYGVKVAVDKNSIHL